jgi:pilus assembly protein CpaE
MSEIHHFTSGADSRPLSVALLGPEDPHRAAVAAILAARRGVRLTEVTLLPGNPADYAAHLAQRHEAVVLDVDSDPEMSLRLVESLNTHGHMYVMAYSARADMKLAIQFMRAGVREFFTFPLDAAEVGAALSRASSRPGVAVAAPKPAGKLLVFLGTKGGCGVTTLASNFALSLAQESEQGTLLIDLGQPLGDVGINLGMRTQYSVYTALQDTNRLDTSFLETLIAKHSSGLSVLAAPTDFPESEPPKEALDKLLAVARQSFEYVVVDAGSRVDPMSKALFEQATTIYLITQVGITELRNAHRMITQFFSTRDKSLQIVLNRYTQRALLFDDSQIAKTLTRPAQWKIPDDYAAARRTRNTATPLALVDSAIAQSIREMARDAGGIVPEAEEKKGFFRLLR